MLRCCGYWSKSRKLWVGYCLELGIKSEGRSWEELVESLTMAASLHLARLKADPSYKRPRLAPFRIRVIYVGIALMHFIRPHGGWGLADLSRRLLVEGT